MVLVSSRKLESKAMSTTERGSVAGEDKES